MTINLITGIGGFVASHLADLLLEKGEVVVGTYRWNEDLSRIKHIKDKITMVPADLNDLSSMIKAMETYKPDYVFHLAAQSYVGDSYAYPVETINTNTLGTVKLLEAVRIVRDGCDKISKCPSCNEWWKEDENGLCHNCLYDWKYNKSCSFDPIIHVCSSSEVYGLVDESLIPIKEDCRFNPSNPYAVGKVGTDMAALLYFTNYGLKTIRTRMFTHTGPRRTMMSAECAFAKQIVEFENKYFSAKTLEQKYKLPDKFILKHGNLDSIRTFADVRDAVKAYYKLVHEAIPGEVYNIGGEKTCTIGDVLNTLISLSPIKNYIETEEDPALLRPYDVTLQIPDISKFEKETGWKAEIPFEKTMEDLLNWWRQNV